MALLCLALCASAAQADDAVTRAPAVVITATRVETPAIDVPALTDRTDGSQVRDHRLQVNISESLRGVAGLQARDRQNYAQDVQISVRGFGARSTFGIRGVRLYVDGIPATLPDGQGQLSNVDLDSVDHMEVLRGPFSALYGNSSGGVIQVFTEDGQGPPTLTPSAAAGSDGTARLGFKLSGADGADGAFGYTASASAFETDGYRRHSAARRRLANIKLNWSPGADSKLTLLANSLALPLAQDPLGLTRAQFNGDPCAVGPVAESFDTRKAVDQTQLGLVGEQRLGAAGRLQWLVYGGHRSTEQFQAIPVATQANALHPGGVIQLARDYRGADLRWTLAGMIAEQPLSLVAGLSYDTLDEGDTAYAGIAWTPDQGWRGGIEVRASGRVLVNDANTDAAAGFAVLGAHLGYGLKMGKVEWTLFGRLDNLLAQRHAGSVIVNEGNARYFEPAQGRTWLAGATGLIRF